MRSLLTGSLSELLVSKWGSLQNNENTIVFYTKQILRGIKYLVSTYDRQTEINTNKYFIVILHHLSHY